MNGWAVLFCGVLIVALLLGGGLFNEFQHLQVDHNTVVLDNQALEKQLNQATLEKNDLASQQAACARQVGELEAGRLQAKAVIDQQALRIASLENEKSQLAAQVTVLQAQLANNGGGAAGGAVQPGGAGNSGSGEQAGSEMIPQTGEEPSPADEVETPTGGEQMLFNSLLLGLVIELVLFGGLVVYIIVRRRAARPKARP